MDDNERKEHNSPGDNTVFFPGNTHRDEVDQPTGDELRARKGRRTRRQDKPVSAQSAERRPRTHLAGEGLYAPTVPVHEFGDDDTSEEKEPRTTVYSPRGRRESLYDDESGSSSVRKSTRGSVKTISHNDETVSSRNNTTRYDEEKGKRAESSTSEERPPKSASKGITVAFSGKGSHHSDVTGTRKKSGTSAVKGASSSRSAAAGGETYRPTKKSGGSGKKSTVGKKTSVDITKQPKTRSTHISDEDTERGRTTPLMTTRAPRKKKTDFGTARTKATGGSARPTDTTVKIDKKPSEKTTRQAPKMTSAPKKKKTSDPKSESVRDGKTAKTQPQKKTRADKKSRISPEEIRISHPKKNRPHGEAANPDSSGTKKKRRTRKQGIAGVVSAAMNYEMALPTVQGRSFWRTAVFLLAVLIIIGCVAFGGIKLFESVCKVHTVKVTGTTAFDKEEIKRFSGIKNGTSMYNINCETVEKRIELSNPYVDASVSRKWPSTVSIRVSDRTAYAAVDCTDKYLLIDEDFTALEFVEKTSEKADALLKIKGVGTDNFKLAEKIGNNHADAHLSDAALILSTLKELNLSYNICEIDVLNVNLIICMTDEGLMIELGTVDNLSEKLTRADGFISQLRSQGNADKGILDMQEGGRYRKSDGTKTPAPSQTPASGSDDVVYN